MRRSLSLLLGLAFVTALVVPAAATAVWHPRPVRSTRANAFDRMQTFTVAGEFSGNLNGEMVINGLPYRVDPNAFVYEIGTGVVPVGTYVDDRYVTVSGTVTRNGTTIYSILVRPAGEVTFQSGDQDGKVGVADPSRPR